MKTIKMLSVTCTVVFALTALSASAATAHEWQMRGEGLTKSTNVTQNATLLFEDTALGAAFRCTVEEKGTIGVAGAGQIASIKQVSCASVSLCEGATTKIEALKLPWNTELVTFEGGLGNHITTSSPEWKWQCKMDGETRIETCLAAPTMTVKNVAPNVEETVSARTGYSCDNGGNLRAEGGGLLKQAEGETIKAL